VAAKNSTSEVYNDVFPILAIALSCGKGLQPNRTRDAKPAARITNDLRIIRLLNFLETPKPLPWFHKFSTIY